MNAPSTHPHRNVRHATACLVLATLAAGALQAENPYWDRFGGLPVTVEQVFAGGGSQELEFSDYRDGMLVAQMEGGTGEVALPVTESMASNLRFRFEGRQAAVDLLAADKFTAALERLRPAAYPLIRFVEIPEAFYQIHTPLRMLLQALVGAGELDEALDVVGRIPLGRVDPEYGARALSLAQALLDAGRHTDAASLAATLPFGEGYRANIAPALRLANRIRDAEKYEAVIPLYRRILEAAPASETMEVRLWLAYSLVLSGRIDEASELIDTLEEPSEDSRLFSLFKLLQGSRAHRQGELRQALDLLTRGFVESEASHPWVPEMLYLIGDCYASLGQPAAASNTWREITALYPASAWSERARQSLTSLPKPPAEAGNGDTAND